jgi:hypothetical protein
MIAEYLRRQAENCLRSGRAAFDLATAERLRYMAAELRAKADEIDDSEDESPTHNPLAQRVENHN